MSYQDDALTKLKEFEGCIPWMYLDSVGNVTTGIGLLLPDATVAEQLPFQQSETEPHVAGAEMVQREYERLCRMEPNHAPRHYRTALSPVLSMETMERLCRERIAQGETALRAIFAGYDALPDPAKVALIDMEYNLGAGGLRKYIHLHAAIASGDFNLAAMECRRQGIQAERNKWTDRQFSLAGETNFRKLEAEII